MGHGTQAETSLLSCLGYFRAPPPPLFPRVNSFDSVVYGFNVCKIVITKGLRPKYCYQQLAPEVSGACLFLIYISIIAG